MKGGVTRTTKKNEREKELNKEELQVHSHNRKDTNRCHVTRMVWTLHGEFELDLSNGVVSCILHVSHPHCDLSQTARSHSHSNTIIDANVVIRTGRVL